MTDDSQLLMDIYDTVVRLDERQRGISKKVDRIDGAVFGNGQPGMRGDLSSLTNRVDEIEKFEKSCPVFEIQASLVSLQQKHDEKEEEEKSAEEEQKVKASEFRRFRWGVVAMFIALALDIALNLFGVI